MDTFWRIFCKTKEQDGSQGEKIEKGAFRCFSFFNETEIDIREAIKPGSWSIPRP